MALIDLQNLPSVKNELPFPYDWAVTVAMRKKYGVPQQPVQPIQPMPPSSRKSARLGLSFAYDWSSPEMDDDVLIWHVLEHGIFTDICQVCKHFGIDKVEHIAGTLPDDPIRNDSLTRMLRNIKIGFSNAEY